MCHNKHTTNDKVSQVNSEYDESDIIDGLKVLVLLFTGATNRDATLSLRFTEDSAGLLTLTLLSVLYLSCVYIVCNVLR